MKQLEGGYSVSDTEDEMTSAMNDILSAHSYYQSKVPGLRNASALGGEMPISSPQLAGSPGVPNWGNDEGSGDTQGMDQ